MFNPALGRAAETLLTVLVQEVVSALIKAMAKPRKPRQRKSR
jgi:hypothetical protein